MKDWKELDVKRRMIADLQENVKELEADLDDEVIKSLGQSYHQRASLKELMTLIPDSTPSIHELRNSIARLRDRREVAFIDSGTKTLIQYIGI